MGSDAERYREWAAKNKEHLREYRKKYYAANRDKALQYAQQWAEQNRDKARAAKQRYADANKEYNRERARQYRITSPVPGASTARWRANNAVKKAAINKQWKEANRHRVRESRARRRACETRSTPTWADVNAMAAIYASCPSGHHVDHVVPLRSKLVCGLHCEANLRVVPARDNLVKGNKEWPDMP